MNQEEISVFPTPDNSIEISKDCLDDKEFVNEPTAELLDDAIKDKFEIISDDSDNEILPENGPATAHEVVELPVIEVVNEVLDKDAELLHLGSVKALVDHQIIIETHTSGHEKVLDFDTVLYLQDRRAFGRVFETFGPVKAPLYIVRFNTESDIAEFGLEPGTLVFFSPPKADYIMTEPLQRLKGTDASNFYDEELAQDEQEFSDDEQERAARLGKKKERVRNATSNSFTQNGRNHSNFRVSGGQSSYKNRAYSGSHNTPNYSNAHPINQLHLQPQYFPQLPPFINPGLFQFPAPQFFNQYPSNAFGNNFNGPPNGSYVPLSSNGLGGNNYGMMNSNYNYMNASDSFNSSTKDPNLNSSNSFHMNPNDNFMTGGNPHMSFNNAHMSLTNSHMPLTNPHMNQNNSHMNQNNPHMNQNNGNNNSNNNNNKSNNNNYACQNHYQQNQFLNN